MGYRDNSKSFSAVCDECGNKCELPFKPSSDKPVYCSDCYKKKQRSNSRQSGRSNFRDGNRGGFRDRDRRMYPAVCNSCGNRCEVPFQPTSGKPVYCDSCFGKDGNSKRGPGGGRDKGRDQVGEQIAALNIKLDKIMKVLKIADELEVAKKEKPAKKNKQVQDKPSKKTPANPLSPKASEGQGKKVAKKTAKKAVKKVAKKKPAKKAAKKKTTKKK